MGGHGTARGHLHGRLMPAKRNGKGQDAPSRLGQIGLLNFIFRVQYAFGKLSTTSPQKNGGLAMDFKIFLASNLFSKLSCIFKRINQPNAPGFLAPPAERGERVRERGSRSHPVRTQINPKGEVERVKIRQDAGAETLWKNRNHTRSALVRVSKRVSTRFVGADWPYEFRFSN